MGEIYGQTWTNAVWLTQVKLKFCFKFIKNGLFILKLKLYIITVYTFCYGLQPLLETYFGTVHTERKTGIIYASIQSVVLYSALAQMSAVS